MPHAHYIKGELCRHLDYGLVRVVEDAPIRGVYTVQYIEVLNWRIGPAPACELRKIYYPGSWRELHAKCGWLPADLHNKRTEK